LRYIDTAHSLERLPLRLLAAILDLSSFVDILERRRRWFMRLFSFHLDLPPKDILVKDPTMPADILGMSGVVIGARVHAHITLANPDRAFGGHLEPDTTVFTFAVVTLGVDDALDLSTVDDWNNR